MDLHGELAIALAGRYEIERELGRGGMAVVYLAHDTKHGRHVALKVMNPELVRAVGAERFLREIALAAPLTHPNILSIYDSDQAGGVLYYVMPFVDGPTLRQRMDKEGPLPIADALAIARQIAAALDYAHAHGVVHRDIKPENVLLHGDHVLVADFGLARGLSVDNVSLTRDHIVGTPAYMSPEQCTPGHVIDGRSDVYSLACTVFEMIAGETPFTVENSMAMIWNQVASAPPSLCMQHEGCPPGLDRAVRKALAKSPADRFASAGEFARAMERADDTGAPIATARWATLRRLVRHPGLARVGLLALLLLGVISAAWTLGRRGDRDTTALDASTYAVFPFRSEGSTAALWLDGDGAARLLHDAVGRWRGIHLVDDMRTSDVWTRARPHTVAEALEAAASLHAGVLAWGEVLPVGDSIEVRAVAYDVSRGPGTTRQFAVRLGREAAQVERAFAMLADSIVIGGAGVDDGAARGTKNLVALREFLDGRAALNQFDLGLAEEQFRKAIDADESYAHAHLWLARTLAWKGDDEPAAWAPDAARAVALSQSLADREKQHAEALLDLSAARMSDACRRYRALIAADSLDFAAWFGLGDCNARDPVVIRDGRSPTGYAFRGSYHTAIAAYRRALTLVPSFHLAERGLAFARLSRRVLFTEEARLRRGIGVGPDTAGYGAFPSFVNDTLAFFPMPYLASTSTTTRPVTERQAVRWSSGVSRQLMAEWVAAFPQSDDAQESYAQALESYAAISGGGVTDALVVARRALHASATADARVRRSAMVVRLLLKADSIGAARAVTDSVLRSVTAPTPSQAGYLAGFAALTGRAARAATLLGIAARDTENVIFATAQGRRPALPFEVAETAHHLLAYASLGGPADSVRDSFLRTTRSIDQFIARPERTVVRETVLRVPFALAYEQLAPLAGFSLSPGRSELLAMRQALARSDTVDARRQSAAFTALTDRYSPGTMGIDRLYQHANILLAMRDTAAAVDRLDRALIGLRYSRQNLLTVIPQAAAIARTMALRARLAQRAGDGKTVDHWAPAAEALWAEADPGIRSQAFRDGRTQRSP